MEERALTHEEHVARAMLLDMRYFGGNGRWHPIYYKEAGRYLHNGMKADMIVRSIIDANTLEHSIRVDQSGFGPVEWVLPWARDYWSMTANDRRKMLQWAR